MRLPGYDYTQAGTYFVTVVTRNPVSVFGKVTDDRMVRNELGRITYECWDAISEHIPGVTCGEFVIMPNNIHGITILPDTVGAQHAAPLPPPPRGNVQSGSLGAIVRSYKSAVTRRINAARDGPGTPIWQRNYYEHVIRTEDELDRVVRYIAENPAGWIEDPENPLRRENPPGPPF